LIKLFSNFTCN